MKKAVLFLLIFFALSLHSQTVDKGMEYVKYIQTYPDGNEAMHKYVAKNLKLPRSARKLDTLLIVSFNVAKNGQVHDAEMEQGADSLINKEILRVINSMPKWRIENANGASRTLYQVLPIALRKGKTIVGYAQPINQRCEPSDTVYRVADRMPQFPGGDALMYKFIMYNKYFPVIAQHPTPRGRVMVEFIVGCNGEVKNEKVLRGFDPVFDAEALRLVRIMPRWQPGVHNGKQVECRYVIPIVFKMN